MLNPIIRYCFAIVCAAVLIGIAIAIVAFIVYLVAGVISCLIDTFREVRAKQRIKKTLQCMHKLAQAAESTKQQK